MNPVLELTDSMSDDSKGRIARAVANLGQRLLGFIRARVPSAADAEDILQDVWRDLAVALEEGPVEQIGAWLYRVARNRVTDSYRKPRMASLDALAEEGDDPALELPNALLRDDKTPESEYLRNLFWDELRAALAELPPEQRQVFVWHELEGLSFQEIAALTGDNLNTLLSRKRYAMLYLRGRFEQFRNDFLK